MASQDKREEFKRYLLQNGLNPQSEADLKEYVSRFNESRMNGATNQGVAKLPNANEKRTAFKRYLLTNGLNPRSEAELASMANDFNTKIWNQQGVSTDAAELQSTLDEQQKQTSSQLATRALQRIREKDGENSERYQTLYKNLQAGRNIVDLDTLTGAVLTTKNQKSVDQRMREWEVLASPTTDKSTYNDERTNFAKTVADGKEYEAREVAKKRALEVGEKLVKKDPSKQEWYNALKKNLEAGYAIDQIDMNTGEIIKPSQTMQPGQDQFENLSNWYKYLDLPRFYDYDYLESLGQQSDNKIAGGYQRSAADISNAMQANKDKRLNETDKNDPFLEVQNIRENPEKYYPMIQQKIAEYKAGNLKDERIDEIVSLIDSGVAPENIMKTRTGYIDKTKYNLNRTDAASNTNSFVDVLSTLGVVDGAVKIAADTDEGTRKAQQAYQEGLTGNAFVDTYVTPAAAEGLAMVPNAAVSMIPGGKGVRLAGKIITTINSTARGYGAGAEQARGEGATRSQQILQGVASAAAEAITERISLDNIFKISDTITARNFKNAAKKIGVSMLTEGSTEALSDVLQNASAKYIYKPDMKWFSTDKEEDSVINIPQLFDTFVISAALGGVMGGAGYVSQARYENAMHGAVQEIIDHPQTIADGFAFQPDATSDNARAVIFTEPDGSIGTVCNDQGQIMVFAPEEAARIKKLQKEGGSAQVRDVDISQADTVQAAYQYKLFRESDGAEDFLSKLLVDNGQALYNETRGDANGEETALRSGIQSAEDGETDGGRLAPVETDGRVGNQAGEEAQQDSGISGRRHEYLVVNSDGEELAPRSGIQSTEDGTTGGGRLAPVETDGRVRNQAGEEVQQGAGGTSGGNEHLVVMRPSIQREFADRDITPVELKSVTDSNAFSNAIVAAKRNNDYGAFVTAYSPEEYDTKKLFLSDDGYAGVAVTDDGDIESVFKNSGSKAKGAVSSLILTAIDNGGIKLDNYDSEDLSLKYEAHGFIPVAKVKFDPRYAPDDWNYDIAREDGQQPDIVFWIHNGDLPETVAQKIGDYDAVDTSNIPVFDTYDQAQRYRDMMIGDVQRRRRQARQTSAQAQEQPTISMETTDTKGNAQRPEVKKGYTVRPTPNGEVRYKKASETVLKNLSRADSKRIQEVEKLAREFGLDKRGIKLQWDADIEAYDGAKLVSDDGFCDRGEKVLHISLDAEDGAYLAVFIHELSHMLEGTAAYRQIQTIAVRRLKEAGVYESMMREYGELYGADEQTYIEQEIVADEVARICNEPAYARIIARGNRGIINKLLNALDTIKARHRLGKEAAAQFESLRTLLQNALEENADNSTAIKRMIMRMPDGRRYVQADRQVIYGNDPARWQKQIYKFINEKIRSGENIEIPTDAGDVVKITAKTAWKMSYQNEYTINGVKKKISQEEYGVKGRAAGHIDELLATSHPFAQKADRKQQKHGRFSQNGFEYRTAYFRDMANDGQPAGYYRLTISIGLGPDWKTAYNIGRIEQIDFPRERKNDEAAAHFKGSRPTPANADPWATKASSNGIVGRVEQDVNTADGRSEQNKKETAFPVRGSKTQPVEAGENVAHPQKEGRKDAVRPQRIPVNKRQALSSPERSAAGAKSNQALRTDRSPLSTHTVAQEGVDVNSIRRGTENDTLRESRKRSKLVNTVQNSEAVSQETKDSIEILKDSGFGMYDVKSNQESVDRARSKLDSFKTDNEVQAHIASMADSGKRMSAEDVALCVLAVNRAGRNGNAEAAQKMIADMRIAITDQAQAIQAVSIFKKLDKTGRLYSLEKVRDQLSKQVEKRLPKKKKDSTDISLNKNLVEELMDSTTRKEGEAIERAALKDMAQQVPATLTDKLTAWRYMSMLANPRTHIRNITGNILMYVASSSKDVAGALIESGVSKVNPNLERTKTLKTLSSKEGRAALAFAKQDAENQHEFLTSDGKEGAKNTLNEGQRVFKNKVLELIRDKNGQLLEDEDAFFIKKRYQTALAKYMLANNLTEDDMKNEARYEKAKTYAATEAWKATFHDASKLAEALNKFEKSGPVAKLVVGGVMPFKKTPINVLKRGAEYSPIGLIDGLIRGSYDLRRGKINANQYIDRIASGLTGSLISGLGALMASMGILRASSSDDDREEYFEKMRGEQSYSLRLLGMSFTIDWAAPICIPLFMGCEAYNVAAKQDDAGQAIPRIIETLANASDPMLQLSCLQGVNDAIDSFNSKDGVLGAIGSFASTSMANYISQFIPTIFGQTARVIDPTRKTTYASKDSAITQPGEKFIRKLANKIPILSSTLQPYVDQWGELDTGTKNILLRSLEQYIFPWYQNDIEENDRVNNELERLYAATGESKVLPNQPRSSFEIDKKKYYVASNNISTYQKAYGKTARGIVEDMISLDVYRKLDDSQKTEAIASAYQYANEYAKENGSKLPYKSNVSWVAKANEAKKQGISIATYIIARQGWNDVEGVKGKDGRTISGTKKANQIKYLNTLALTAKQKQYLLDLWTQKK